MSIAIESWKPRLVGDELLRRLQLINTGDGFNTNPFVDERWEWPEEVSEGNLPRVMLIEDRIDLEEGVIQSTSTRGKLRLRHYWYVWGVVASDYNVRVARHELLADVKSALFTGERLPSPDATTGYALSMGIESIDFDGNALQDMQRGFFVVELSVQVDILREE